MGDVIGWKLDPEQRGRLLDQLAPHWPDVIADHVTLQAKAPEAAPLPEPKAADIIGEVDDGHGLQAMVVRIDGTTARPGGGTYHITWSLDRSRGRHAEESNDVLAERGWITLPEPVPLDLHPARF